MSELTRSIWFVVQVAGQPAANLWHTGSLPGTTTELAHRGDGISWAVVFNQRDESYPGAYGSSIDLSLRQAAAAVTSWPAHDFSGRYFTLT
jgi:hypothetical protein